MSSAHSSIDAYSLQLDPPTLRSGQTFNLIFPASTAGYDSGFVFDLEEKTPSGEWLLTARLASPLPVSEDRDPKVISPRDDKTLDPLVARSATGSVPLILPDDARGDYRLVAVLRRSEPVSIQTVAVEFTVQD